MDCVLVGTNLRQMTSTGCVVRGRTPSYYTGPSSGHGNHGEFFNDVISQTISSTCSLRKKATLQQPNLVIC